MKLEFTTGAVRDRSRMTAPVRNAVLGVLTGLANDPSRLDDSAVPLNGDDAETLELSADAVAQAADGRLKAIGVTVRGQ